MRFEDTRAAADAIRAELGAIDILVNNVGGIVPRRGDDGLTAEALDDLEFVDNLSLSLVSAYRATQAVLPAMLERGYGRIINIGSGYAKRSGGPVPYTAAKHGIIGLTRALAANVALNGVTINCLCPGWANTQLVDFDRIAELTGEEPTAVKARIEFENLQRRVLEPEELGPMAALLAAEESAGITGQVISVDGGYKV